MKTTKILVVDYDLITLTMLKTALSSVGYEVITASNGMDAVLMAKNHLPFLIILDIMMPEMAGGEVADILKAYRKTKEIPIIFLSSMIPLQKERLSSVKGSVSLMAKPLNLDKLLNEVRKHYLCS